MTFSIIKAQGEGRKKSPKPRKTRQTDKPKTAKEKKYGLCNDERERNPEQSDGYG